ncbi:MAG: helix-turn-helix domain-containing protein [Fimbriimonadaceae bacterium]|nr:helix-turn-helix domain-containing protein [Fimbriimonadaceae bacterium]
MKKEISSQAPILLTVRESASVLGISRTTLYLLINQGRLRVVRIGSRGVRIPVSELEKFVDDQVENSDKQISVTSTE